MNFVELLIIAIGLSMDAFAVSIGKGLSLKKIKLSHALKVGLWFGGFQALMPLIGYMLGSTFAEIVSTFDHWVAFVLLSLIGGNMIKESLENDSDNDCDCNKKDKNGFGLTTMFTLAVATSIDALAIGVTFAFFKVAIFPAIITIGITTLIFSVAGLKIGNIFGCKYKSHAELFGGVILILIGLKILIEHTFFS
ncbi:MAG: manganese efflux pump [Muribaculaceae bacterium]|nr:manganese efflux pump [Muribaculaceae bacterium]